MNQQIRFCKSFDGTRIAYAISGNGPPLLKAPHWVTHLEHDWDSPVWRPSLTELSRRYTLIRFDQRGNGLSDREPTDISFEAFYRDLEAVANAAGLEQFALYGLSQAAAVAIAYAARHAEKVSHLILHGGYARGFMMRHPTPRQIAQRETEVKLMELGWGTDEPSFRQVFATQFMPDASLEHIRSFCEMMRLSASPAVAVRIRLALDVIEVGSEVPLVKCPTLVMHARGDLRIPFEEGRWIATQIPGARFVPLESRNHVLLETEPAWRVCLAAMDDFFPTGTHSAAVFSELTDRERDILERLAQGLDNAQIAAHLNLAEKTVRNHITHIFDKLGVENRSQAIVLARERGLGLQSRSS
jgi:pimeloyl-ACP methyl ester carboxylesterase/DNA-binding CsgD family transcriptional regulator